MLQEYFSVVALACLIIFIFVVWLLRRNRTAEQSGREYRRYLDWAIEVGEMRDELYKSDSELIDEIKELLGQGKSVREILSDYEGRLTDFALCSREPFDQGFLAKVNGLICQVFREEVASEGTTRLWLELKEDKNGENN